MVDQGRIRLVEDDDAVGHVLASPAPGPVTVTNFGDSPVTLPAGEVLLSSAPLEESGSMPSNTTVWLRVGVGS